MSLDTDFTNVLLMLVFLDRDGSSFRPFTHMIHDHMTSYQGAKHKEGRKSPPLSSLLPKPPVAFQSVQFN